MVSSDGETALIAEEIVDTESLRLRPNFSSSASKIGDGGAELSSLDSSERVRSSSSISFSVNGRNSPPWMGGKKLVQRPSIRPIWNLLMR